VNLGGIHAHIRVHRAGVKHIQFGNPCNELLPQVLVQLRQVLDGFHDGVFVADLQQESQDA